MAEPTTEHSTEQQQPHARASKVASYFATSGVISWGLTVLATVLYAPLSLPGILFIGAGIAMAATEGGRNFARKLGDQLVDLGNDFMSHLSEDVGRLGKWWHRVTAPKPKAPVVAKGAPEAPSTFKPAASAPDFNNAVKPAVTNDDVKPPVIQPGQGPKPVL
ncbi:MAG: hypothetical protein EPN97_07455 [Alphaproteobacteria bacterium]|nr:MAG: hypothetical protein EPN97_07455 [Alphaproteobacteria bacterium]